MGTAKVDKLIRQLNPEYLEELAEYVRYLLYLQENRDKEKDQSGKELIAETEKPEEDIIPERLKIARKYAGDAPYPDAPTSKYDVYEQ